jgi:predicted Rossmann-fold nucleotide-binding protein
MKKKRDETLRHWLRRLPGADRIPFQVNRRGLYRVSDLYRGYDPSKPESWTKAFDHSVYQWTLDPKASKPKARRLKSYEVIAERLHDAAIGHGIDRILGVSTARSGKPVVGFMGGHDTDRDDPAFVEVAMIARVLRRENFTIVSGGGPGLMEAANFGAFMAPYTETEFAEAMGTLKNNPKASNNADWVASACAVREKLLRSWNAREKQQSESLGIPTWYYGNEPPNLFATHTGKYFFNSVREDGLVSIASGGIIFGPGKAGTVQEIFQDAPLNFYRQKNTRPTPMVLLGVDYWNPPCENDSKAKPSPDDGRKPVWPLLSTLAQQAGDNKFKYALLLTDDRNAVVKFISNFHARTMAASATGLQRAERLKGRALASL